MKQGASAVPPATAAPTAAPEPRSALCLLFKFVVVVLLKKKINLFCSVLARWATPPFGRLILTASNVGTNKGLFSHAHYCRNPRETY